ncbi:hypothetical protein [Brevundimonas sp.]|uniref:hypothetical protein n=1 Tax=Brevundimonas sp. TaxID=1871086 RepID=UPI0039194B75
MMFGKPTPIPDWYGAMVASVEAFAASLPESVEHNFERGHDHFLLDILPPSALHRRLTLEGSLGEFDYTLGEVWTERLDPSPSVCTRVLAALEAVRDGKVREVRDRRTGVIYHVYRLTTHGLSEFMQDGQYSLWRRLRLKIRNVQIHTLPPLTKAH